MESIVAAAIVALALAACLRVVGEAASRDRGLAARREAVLIAQSELDDVGSEIPLAQGDASGLAGDFVWRVEVSPYLGAGEATAAGGLWRIQVAVRARAGGADLVRLESLRLGGKA